MSRTKPSVPPTQAMVRGACVMLASLRTVQNPECNFVQLAVANHYVRPVYVRVAVPITKAAARLLDDRLHRGDVPDVDTVLHHQFAGALGHEHETVEIPEPSLPLCACGQVEELMLATGLDEPGDARI